jgi:hypothetical protein
MGATEPEAAGAFKGAARPRRLCYPLKMTDRPPNEPPETPIQRALRMKKAAIEAKPKPPRGGKHQREQAAMAAGASKPWLKK